MEAEESTGTSVALCCIITSDSTMLPKKGTAVSHY